MTEADLERRLVAPTGGETRRDLRRGAVTLSLPRNAHLAAHPGDGHGDSPVSRPLPPPGGAAGASRLRLWRNRRRHFTGGRAFADHTCHTPDIAAGTGEARAAPIFVGVSGRRRAFRHVTPASWRRHTSGVTLGEGCGPARMKRSAGAVQPSRGPQGPTPDRCARILSCRKHASGVASCVRWRTGKSCVW